MECQMEIEELKATKDELIRLKTEFSVCKEFTENLLGDLKDLRDELKEKLMKYRQDTKHHFQELEKLSASAEAYKNDLSKELGDITQAARGQLEDLKELRVYAENYQDKLNDELRNSKQATELHFEELTKLRATVQKDNDELRRKLEGLQEARGSPTMEDSEQEESTDPSLKLRFKRLRGLFGKRSKSKQKKQTLSSSVSEIVATGLKPTEPILYHKDPNTTPHTSTPIGNGDEAEETEDTEERLPDVQTRPPKPPAEKAPGEAKEQRDQSRFQYLPSRRAQAATAFDSYSYSGESRRYEVFNVEDLFPRGRTDSYASSFASGQSLHLSVASGQSLQLSFGSEGRSFADTRRRPNSRDPWLDWSYGPRSSAPDRQELAQEIHEAITIIEEPSSQNVKEGSKVELVFKCKARGNSKLTYQWFKDGEGLQGKDEGTLVFRCISLPDFGWYKCVAICKDSRDSVESQLAELDVVPRDGTVYKCLRDIDFYTQHWIEIHLTQTSSIVAGWRQIAFKYGMDQLKIKSLESDPEAGKRTLEYLWSSNPDLTVYDFCKTLKEHNIRRLDIVHVLRGHLSVPS